MVKYRFIDDKPEEKPVARFRYSKTDQFGNKEKVTFYGHSFEDGEVTEVADEYAANKLRTAWKGAFEEVEGDENGTPKKRGRPRKTDEEREAERQAGKDKREAEKEGAQPKTSEEDFEEGETF
jgi:hypothetical protein